MAGVARRSRDQSSNFTHAKQRPRTRRRLRAVWGGGDTFKREKQTEHAALPIKGIVPDPSQSRMTRAGAGYRSGLGVSDGPAFLDLLDRPGN